MVSAVCMRLVQAHARPTPSMERRGGCAVSLLDRDVLTADGCWEEEIQFKSRAPGKLDHIPVEDHTSEDIEVPQIGLDG